MLPTPPRSPFSYVGQVGPLLAFARLYSFVSIRVHSWSFFVPFALFRGYHVFPPRCKRVAPILKHAQPRFLSNAAGTDQQHQTALNRERRTPNGERQPQRGFPGAFAEQKTN